MSDEGGHRPHTEHGAKILEEFHAGRGRYRVCDMAEEIAELRADVDDLMVNLCNPDRIVAEFAYQAAVDNLTRCHPN